ncbi:hypothetical protein BJF90_13285 [Pseudonocardia sp. CNS-004]|nr:hypothetical protein BJF90_13285 [Pseudonocardia sp. CNS-004]
MTQIVIPRSVVTADPVTSEVTCTAGQAVVVEGGIITEVAPAAEIETRHPDVEPQRFPRAILTPGFVNSHHHVGLTPFQLGVPDSSLETWIAARAAHPTLDLRLDTTYSAVQMLRSGVTTVQHVQGWHSTDASDLTASAQAVLDTYGEIGMRGSYSKMVRDQNLLIHDQDESLLDRLPVEQHDRFSAYLKGLRVPLTEQLGLFEELHAGYADDPLLVVQLAPANFHWTSDEALEQLGETSARTGVPMHMHLLETIYQSMYMDRRAGAERVSYLARSGVLSDRLTLGTAPGSRTPTSRHSRRPVRTCATTAARTSACRAVGCPCTTSSTPASTSPSASTRPASTTTATCFRRCGWSGRSTASRVSLAGGSPRRRSSPWPPSAAPGPPATGRATARSRLALPRTSCCSRRTRCVTRSSCPASPGSS